MKRLGCQRKEANQVYNIIIKNQKVWSNHPAVTMWRGHTNCLALYYNTTLEEWERRGYHNIKLSRIPIIGPVIFPKWMGNYQFHLSHQSNLIRKKPEHYKQFFNVDGSLPYIWPT